MMLFGLEEIFLPFNINTKVSIKLKEEENFLYQTKLGPPTPPPPPTPASPFQVKAFFLILSFICAQNRQLISISHHYNIDLSL